MVKASEDQTIVGSTAVRSLSSNNSEQVVHTLVPLPSCNCEIKVKADIALLGGNPTSQPLDVTCHMASHITCHPTQVSVPCLTPAMQAGTRFTYPGGMED